MTGILLVTGELSADLYAVRLIGYLQRLVFGVCVRALHSCSACLR